MENDSYFTPAWVTHALLDVETFDGPIWECAPGEGHMVRALQERGYQVTSWPGIDFLTKNNYSRAIVSNPPFSKAEKIIRHALHLTIPEFGKVAMLLPFSFDAAAGRAKLFRERPFKAKYTLTRRIRWENLEQKAAGPSTNHAWYIWDWAFTGKPYMGWLPKAEAA